MNAVYPPAMISFRSLGRSLVLFALAGGAGALAAPRAEACAVLPSNGVAAPPDLARERVLIAFDRETRTEHFVREVRFARATTRFAFLVPTPSRPEVEKVEQAPFDALESKYPFHPPEPEPLFGSRSKSASGAAVEVHEVKRIGSFTAFVLSATDAAALDAWFTENDIARPPSAIQWLEHFVAKRFFVTAFRYEPPREAAGEIDAETVRLGFRTDEAYYPYIEPLRSGEPGARVLSVWTMAEGNLVPAALFAPRAGPVHWQVAWQEGGAYDASRTELAALLPGVAAFLPHAGTVRVQTFLDTRWSRDGVSDVVLANEGDRPEEAGFRTRAAALLGDLEKLIHTGDHPASPEGGALDAFQAHPFSRGCACDVAGGPAHGGALAAAALPALLGLLGRRRARRGSRGSRGALAREDAGSPRN